MSKASKQKETIRQPKPPKKVKPKSDIKFKAGADLAGAV